MIAMDYMQKPKNWRLACQTKVGEPDSNGLVCDLAFLYLCLTTENGRN